MNLTLRDSVALIQGILGGHSFDGGGPEVMVAPPFTALARAAEVLKGSPVLLAAQNMHFENSGAFTGEVSPVQIQDVSCQAVILGHSERRRIFGETDAIVKRKLQAALAHELIPVVCVGETIDERESNKTFQVIETQMEGALEGFPAGDLSALVIAYEPVWAIGTGKTAAPAQAEEAHAFIRKTASKLFGDGPAQSLRILYGGSVTPDNIDALMAEPDIDGALVGGASLKVASFLRIIQFKAPAKAAHA